MQLTQYADSLNAVSCKGVEQHGLRKGCLCHPTAAAVAGVKATLTRSAPGLLPVAGAP